MQMRMYARARAFVCVRAHKYMCVSLGVRVCVYLCVRLCAWMHLCVHCVCVCVCWCVYACVCARTHAYGSVRICGIKIVCAKCQRMFMYTSVGMRVYSEWMQFCIVHKFTCACALMSLSAFVWEQVCVWVCLYARMYCGCRRMLCVYVLINV